MAAPRNSEYDAIVVGAGVLGTFHAYFAARRGLRVLLIERDDQPRGASVRNFGWCIPSAMPPGEWTERGLAGLDIYRELSELTGLRLSRRGTQYVASTPLEAAVLAEYAGGHGNQRLRCELLNRYESLQLNGAIRAEYCLGSLYFPDEVRIEPRTMLNEVIDWLQAECAVDYRPRTVAIAAGVQGGRGRVSVSDGAVYEAEHVFVCSGADLRTLFPQRLAAAGLQHCRLQMMRTVPQGEWELPTNVASGLSIRRYRSFQNCPSWPELSAATVRSGLDERGIHVLLVQDFAGRLIVGDSHHYADNEGDDALEAETEALILAEAGRIVNAPDWTIERRWQGGYTVLRQGELFADTLDGRLHLITGIGGKGMTTGPAVARESIEAAFESGDQ